MSDRTNLTELAGFFPANPAAKQPSRRVMGVAPRFWQPGDTYEQALVRQQASFAVSLAARPTGRDKAAL